jgi:pilus assembly protein CpaB
VNNDSGGPLRGAAWLRFNRVVARRRLLAVVFAGAAIFWALSALRPAVPPTVPIQIAARDLSAGTVVTAGDIATREVPQLMVPRGAVASTNALVGRTIASPLRAAEIVTDVRLVGPGMLAGVPSGVVAVPVRIADEASAALLSSGDTIDLVAQSPPELGASIAPRVVATAVRVVSVLSGSSTTGSSTNSRDGALIVVAVPRREAPDIAATAGGFAVIIR